MELVDTPALQQCQVNFSPVLAGNFPVSNAAAAPSGKQQQQPPAVNMRSFSRIQFLSGLDTQPTILFLACSCM